MFALSEELKIYLFLQYNVPKRFSAFEFNNLSKKNIKMKELLWIIGENAILNAD
jgi:hypothetical protein